MAFVVDASVAASWLMPDEYAQAAEAARLRIAADVAAVPALWWFEVRNLLITNERRGRINAAHVSRALHLLAALRIAIDSAPDEVTVLTLARKHRLTVYDAAYLELALRLDCPLATLDQALLGAARAEQVVLVGEV